MRLDYGPQIVSLFPVFLMATSASSPSSSTAAQALTEVPDCDYLRSLEARSDLKEIGFRHALPLLVNPDVRKALGATGTSFARIHQIASRIFHDASNKRVLGCLYFPMTVEGPHASVHGGAIATAFDEAFGLLLSREAGLGNVTANLSVNYRGLIPLGSVVAIECHIVKVEGRKIRVEGSIFDPTTGKLYDDGSALFMTPSRSRQLVPWVTLEAIMGPQSQMTPEQIVQMIRKRRQSHSHSEGASATTTAKL